MKKYTELFVYAILLLGLAGCRSLPANYSNYPLTENTGLGQLIGIDGYYICPRECDTTFYSIFRFYPNGRFRITTTGTITPQLAKCFVENDNSTLCKNILEGRYTIIGDTIKTETIWPVGNGCVVFRNYIIRPDNSIEHISEYVDPQYSNLSYIANYPSFYNNPCARAAELFPYPNVGDLSE